MSALTPRPRVHEQQLDLTAAIDTVLASKALIADITDHRRMPPNDGAARLLRALVRRGLTPDALRPAARLVLAVELLAATSHNERERTAA